MEVTLQNVHEVVSYRAPGSSQLESIGMVRAAAEAFIVTVLQVNADRLEHEPLSDDAGREIEQALQGFYQVALNTAVYCDDRSAALGKAGAAATIIREKISSQEKTQQAVRFIREAMMTLNAAIILRGLI
jgi:hypothetical protein